MVLKIGKHAWKSLSWWNHTKCTSHNRNCDVACDGMKLHVLWHAVDCVVQCVISCWNVLRDVSGCLRVCVCCQQIKRVTEPGGFLRVLVDSGGCSGFQYKFELDRTIEHDDRWTHTHTHALPCLTVHYSPVQAPGLSEWTRSVSWPDVVRGN